MRAGDRVPPATLRESPRVTATGSGATGKSSSFTKAARSAGSGRSHGGGPDHSPQPDSTAPPNSAALLENNMARMDVHRLMPTA